MAAHSDKSHMHVICHPVHITVQVVFYNWVGLPHVRFGL